MVKTSLINAVEKTVTIPVAGAAIEGFLKLPLNARGIVVFVHGSGSSRFSPRNRAVADYLSEMKTGTLLFDLLTSNEEEQDLGNGTYRFNVPFLAGRLGEVTSWLTDKFKAWKIDMPIGYFGASTGAAAAIEAAVQGAEKISAIVSRGGRPDLAHSALPKLKTPVLLIVGGEDHDVLRLNREVYRIIHAPKELYIVKGATHLFEEPGALEEVARKAGEWFKQYFL